MSLRCHLTTRSSDADRCWPTDWFNIPTRNDLGFLYNVHVDKDDPRTIKKLTLVPLRRGLQGWSAPESVLQVNRLPRRITVGPPEPDPDWLQLRHMFTNFCFLLGTELQTNEADETDPVFTIPVA